MLTEVEEALNCRWGWKKILGLPPVEWEVARSPEMLSSGGVCAQVRACRSIGPTAGRLQGSNSWGGR